MGDILNRIIYTRPDDGGVTVCCPTGEILDAMASGGFWGRLMVRGTIDEIIASQVAAGHGEDVSARFVRACAFGGISEPEAWAIIRDRDCSGGKAHDIVAYSDLPDRWFRDAWRRSQNGGPIRIDLGLARTIQWQHIRQAIKDEQQLRERDLFAAELVVDLAPIKTAIRRCDDIGQLKRIWPEGVTHGVRSTGTTARNDASPVYRR